MKQYGNVKVTKEIENCIKKKIVALDEPYTFKLYGTPNVKCTTPESARRGFEKIKNWAESNFAAVEIIEDTLINYGYRPTKSLYLKVKITDPAAFAIEEILKTTK